jgi:DNA invertase Pin-like site-specific DNA recombinase
MVKVAIYYRPCPFIEDNAIQQLRDYAKAQEWEIIEYMEAKGKGQPVLSNLLRSGKNEEFSVVLVYSLLTVGGTSLKQLLTVMDKLRVLGISFISLKDGLNTDSSAGTLLESLMRYIKESQSQKIKLSLELCRMRNVVIGRKPLAADKVAEIIEAHKGERSVRDVAKLTHIPKSTCFRVIKDFEKGQAAAV